MPPLEIPDEFALFRGLAPGWYRDSEDPSLARYWDGKVLHPQRRPVARPSPIIATSTPARWSSSDPRPDTSGDGPAPSDNEPWFRQKRYRIPGAIIVGVLLMAGALSVTLVATMSGRSATSGTRSSVSSRPRASRGASHTRSRKKSSSPTGATDGSTAPSSADAPSAPSGPTTSVTGPGNLLTAILPTGWVENTQATDQLWNSALHNVTLDVLVLCESVDCGSVELTLSVGNAALMGVDDYFQNTLGTLEQTDPETNICSPPKTSSLFAPPVSGEHAVGGTQETICSPQSGSQVLLATDSQVSSSCANLQQDYVGDQIDFTYLLGTVSTDLSSQFVSIVDSVNWPFSSFCT